MPGVSDIKGTVPFFGNRVVLVSDEDQNVAEIIKAITEAHKLDKTDYDQFSHRFWKGDAEHTGRELFSFLKKNVTYDIEPEADQTVKTPGVILHHRYGDCKHYALWICGVCDSLNRQGYPIEAKYRFVSDYPNAEVHHVFAVIKDKRGEYWCDPVIRSFNVRPHFHNITDYSMAISRLSGSGTDGINGTFDTNVAIVAGIERLSNAPESLLAYLQHHGRSLKDFKDHTELKNFLISRLHHDINAHIRHHKGGRAHRFHNEPGGEHHSFLNRPGGEHLVGKKHKQGHNNFFKKIKHGFEVNTANIKHGIEVNAANAKAMALKVTLSEARGPFLSLVDINLFNMAHHLRDTLMGKERGHLLDAWKKMGGNPRALINAVNNGYRAYKKHHGGWNQKTDRVNGSINGPEIAAWLALASGIIAALGKFMHFSPDEKKGLAGKVVDGAAALAESANDMHNLQTAVQNGDTAAIEEIKNKMNSGANNGAMNIATGVADDGTPTMVVSHVSHPDLHTGGTNTDANDDHDAVPGGGEIINANADDPGSAGESGSKGDRDPNSLINVPKHLGTDVMRDFIGPLKDQVARIWASYKMPIVLAAGGFVAYKVATRKKKKKR